MNHIVASEFLVKKKSSVVSQQKILSHMITSALEDNNISTCLYQIEILRFEIQDNVLHGGKSFKKTQKGVNLCANVKYMLNNKNMQYISFAFFYPLKPIQCIN